MSPENKVQDNYDAGDCYLKTVEKNVQELQRRLIDKTNDFLASEAKNIARITELEGVIFNFLNNLDDKEGVMANIGLLRVALRKNKARYQ